MIVFDLKCGGQGHVFEAWFASSDAFEEQRGRGLVQCPLCGSEEVEKAVMAPRVGAKGNRTSGPPSQIPAAGSEAAKAMLVAMAKAQKKVLEGSDFVGDRFADEARAIHLGESDARSIYGRATMLEAKSLSREGIKITPLPFPVADPGSEN
jgi:hypothetical protein